MKLFTRNESEIKRAIRDYIALPTKDKRARRMLICKKYDVSEQTFYDWKNRFQESVLKVISKRKQLDADEEKTQKNNAHYYDLLVAALKKLSNKNTVIPELVNKIVRNNNLTIKAACKILQYDPTKIDKRMKVPIDDDKVIKEINWLLQNSLATNKTNVARLLHERNPKWSISMIKKIANSPDINFHTVSPKERLDGLKREAYGNKNHMPFSDNKEWFCDIEEVKAIDYKGAKVNFQLFYAVSISCELQKPIVSVIINNKRKPKANLPNILDGLKQEYGLPKTIYIKGDFIDKDFERWCNRAKVEIKQIDEEAKLVLAVKESIRKNIRFGEGYFNMVRYEIAALLWSNRRTLENECLYEE